MSQRTKMLPAQRFTQALARLVADVTDLKNAQRTSGRSGVIGYQSSSTSTWDLTGTIGTNGDTSTITSTFTVSFTGDGTQTPVMANLSFLFYTNGTDSAHQLTPLTNSWTDGTRSATLQYGSITETQLGYTQPLTLVTLKAVTYFIKIYAVGSSGGTVSAVKTS